MTDFREGGPFWPPLPHPCVAPKMPILNRVKKPLKQISQETSLQILKSLLSIKQTCSLYLKVNETILFQMLSFKEKDTDCFVRKEASKFGVEIILFVKENILGRKYNIIFKQNFNLQKNLLHIFCSKLLDWRLSLTCAAFH